MDLTQEQIKITREAYDSKAFEYATRVERNKKVSKEVEDLLLVPFEGMLKKAEAKKLAFVGCGTCRDLKWFKDKGYECWGYDISEGMLEEAKKWVDDIPLHLLDVATDPLPKNFFDGVYCESALNYISRNVLSDALENIHSSLKKGGYALLCFKVNGESVYKDDLLGSVRYYLSFNKGFVINFVDLYFTVVKMSTQKDSFGRETSWMQLFLKKK